ncbi:hypothetical protein IQ06DRAFT_353996 [Phaeosphaeriaceae sp. SRC1lsM3a]|nr:hypothetical protein IQ06DRAFT_353996 [Stagonospora sp. SRC1lsM3a]
MNTPQRSEETSGRDGPLGAVPLQWMALVVPLRGGARSTAQLLPVLDCKFVNVIKPYALKGGIYFAVQGAGQQPAPGCTNANDTGVTLDLCNLTGIELEDDFVSIGAGERWGKVYDKVIERGLGVTGSRSALGGIGGLALAGDLSFFCSREGFICDNVVDYEII